MVGAAAEMVAKVGDAAKPTEATETRKGHRKRKRHVYNGIRSQMEFYFGDANLTKDRFLRQLIDKEPFVPLEVFLTFNKMKALAGNVDDIARSLSNSQIIELDETQQKVRRKTAVPIERNVDEKTLYVEALPPKADHDWVRGIFERFGGVSYVSLPKYAKTRKIKEFGFVEFEKEASVAKAIKAFADFNGVLDMQAADPAELISVRAFVKEQEAEDTNAPELGKKRANPNEMEHDHAEPLAKKLKTDAQTLDEEESNGTSTAPEDDEVDEMEQTAGEDSTVDGETTDTDAPQPTEGKQDGTKKRRKKKSKSGEKRKKDAELNLDAAYYQLKVLPKRDWKRLRNKYLNLQRERMSELKRKAWKDRQQQAAEQQGKAGVAAAKPPPVKKLKQSNKRKLQQKMNMNFYGAGDEESTFSQGLKASVKETKQNPAFDRAPLFAYEPGLIVEVSLLSPCVQVKEFKIDMRQYAAVKYVDIKEGGMHAHLRLENATAAEDFVRQVNSAENQCKVLAGDAENEYWRKIELDREHKLNKVVKVPHRRGREKIRKLVTQHIRFGDDEEE